MKTKKWNFIPLILAVVCVAAVVVSAVFWGRTSEMKSGDSGLPMDVSAYDVKKMYTYEEGWLVGTTDGYLLCYDPEGNQLWAEQPFGDTDVNDIRIVDGRVFAAFANRKILAFDMEEASDTGDSPVAEDSTDAEENARAGLAELPSALTYNLQDVIPSSLEFGGGEYFAVQGADSRTGYLLALPIQPSEEELYEDGTYRLFDHELWRDSRNFQAFCITENDELYYTTKTSQLRRYLIEGDGLKEEAVATYETPLLGLTGRGEGLAGINAAGELYLYEQLPTSESNRYLRYSMNLGKQVESVYHTGENFLLGLRGGGVASVDTSTPEVRFVMDASRDSTVIMSAEDSFLLRTYQVGEPVTLNYYTYDYAIATETLENLLWLFVTCVFVFGLAGVVLGCCSYRPLAAKICGLGRSFGRALKTYRLVYLSLIPTFVLLAIFYYFPIGFGFALSFTDYLPGDHMYFVGFENFMRVVTNSIFLQSVGSMLIFLVADLLKALIPPILFAEAIFAVRSKRFSFWVRALLFIPGILPGVAGSLVWAQGIFGSSENGLVNAIIKLFVPSYADVNFFGSGNGLAIFSFIMFSFPWIGSYLIFYGAITGVPSSMYEAAKLDGCGWWKRIVRLDLPMILPQIKYIFITSFIASIQNYSTIYVVLGAEGPVYTPALLMYREIMTANYGTASAMSVFLFLFLAIATFLNFRMQSDKTV